MLVNKEPSELPSYHLSKQTVITLIGFLLAAMALFAGIELLIVWHGEGLRELLRFERAAHGELWRLLTSHFVHLGWSHLLLNMAGLVALVVVFADNVQRGSVVYLWLLPSLLIAVAASLCFYVFTPGLGWYVGFSGVLHGLMVLNMLFAKPFWPQRLWWVLLGGLCLKLAYETAIGPLPGSEETAGGNVITAAHLIGAIVGLFYGFLLLLLQRPRSSASA